MLSTSSPCVIIFSGRLGLFDFLLLPTIGLNIGFVALFEEQRAASAARWVGSLPHVCRQGEEIDGALTVMWERRPWAHSSAVTGAPAKVS